MRNVLSRTAVVMTIAAVGCASTRQREEGSSAAVDDVATTADAAASGSAGTGAGSGPGPGESGADPMAAGDGAEDGDGDAVGAEDANESTAPPDAGVLGPACEQFLGARGLDSARPTASDGTPLVIDVHTWTAMPQVNPDGSGQSPFTSLLWAYDTERYPWLVRSDGCVGQQCFSREEHQALVLQGSDTGVALLHGPSYEVDEDGTGARVYAALSHQDGPAVSQWLDQGPKRVLFVASIMPQDRPELQRTLMEQLAPDAIAFRANTAWQLDGGGFFLDDEVGTDFIEHGLSLGVSVFLLPKGMPRRGLSPEHANPRDIGPVAARFPEARLVVLQSAFEYGFEAGGSSRPGEYPDMPARWGEGVGHYPEGPYAPDDPDTRRLYPLDRGVNSLITSLLEHGIGPNENVYAALDGVWAELMARPEEAAHVLGKLLLYVGEDNVLWGTQSLGYGGPQPQIEAFRAFQMPQELIDRYGYPELTELAKTKILGLNAARLLCSGR